MSRLDLSLIEAGLNTYFVAKSDKNEVWNEIVSTNDRAIALAQDGAAEGTLVIARSQTGGRGRQGRSWVSPKDAGIFLSIILRPTIDASLFPLISFVAAVAAAEAIERVGSTKIGLKWVNDLVFEGKKLGGILAEMPGHKSAAKSKSNGQSNEPEWVLPPAVIVGMGINLNLESATIPDELKDRIIALDQICGKTVDANQVVSEFCNAFEEQYNHLRHSAQELVLIQWRRYSHTLGKEIKATMGSEELNGYAEDITESGALVLRLENGEHRILHAGEISIRLHDGSYS